MRNNKSRALAAVALTAAFFCCGAAVQALWIPLKGGLVQVLLQRSWEQGLDGAIDARPWPWADTHPVARIHAHLPEAEKAPEEPREARVQ